MTTDDVTPAIPPGLARDIERALSDPSARVWRPRPVRHPDPPVTDYASVVNRHASGAMAAFYGKLEAEAGRVAAAGRVVTGVNWRVEADPDAPVGSVRLTATLFSVEGQA